MTAEKQRGRPRNGPPGRTGAKGCRRHPARYRPIRQERQRTRRDRHPGNIRTSVRPQTRRTGARRWPKIWKTGRMQKKFTIRTFPRRKSDKYIGREHIAKCSQAGPGRRALATSPPPTPARSRPFLCSTAEACLLRAPRKAVRLHHPTYGRQTPRPFCRETGRMLRGGRQTSFPGHARRVPTPRNV